MGTSMNKPLAVLFLLLASLQGGFVVRAAPVFHGKEARAAVEKVLLPFIEQYGLIGVATRNGVEVTARQTYDLGFNVTLATDAMTDMQSDAHIYSIARVFPRIDETGTTQEIIDLMKRST